MAEPYDVEWTDFLLFGRKTCRTCGVTKPACTSYFNADADNIDGMKATCKACRQERVNAHYAADADYRERHNAAQRRRYLETKAAR